jgi:hypothetical protein
MAGIRHISEKIGVRIQGLQPPLQLRRGRQHQVHRSAEISLTPLNQGRRHARLILNAVNAVIYRRTEILDRQIEASERVVGPKQRVVKTQQTQHDSQAGTKQTTIES